MDLKECKYKDKCRFSHDEKKVEAARQAFAGFIEADDYFAEANCVEESSQAQPTMKLKGSNSPRQFRDPHGSPKNQLRELRVFPSRDLTRAPVTPTSKDEKSNLVNHDHYDAHDHLTCGMPEPTVDLAMAYYAIEYRLRP